MQATAFRKRKGSTMNDTLLMADGNLALAPAIQPLLPDTEERVIPRVNANYYAVKRIVEVRERGRRRPVREGSARDPAREGRVGVDGGRGCKPSRRGAANDKAHHAGHMRGSERKTCKHNQSSFGDNKNTTLAGKSSRISTSGTCS